MARGSTASRPIDTRAQIERDNHAQALLEAMRAGMTTETLTDQFDLTLARIARWATLSSLPEPDVINFLDAYPELRLWKYANFLLDDGLEDEVEKDEELQALITRARSTGSAVLSGAVRMRHAALLRCAIAEQESPAQDGI